MSCSLSPAECVAHAGERGGWYGHVVDSGVLSWTVEVRPCGRWLVAMVMWWLTRVVAKVVVFFLFYYFFFGGAPVAGSKHGGERRGVSVVIQVHRQYKGVHLAGSWLRTPSTQSLIWITVVREIFDLGSGLK